ncbi:hypothetical protein [Arthrobacter sp. GMC3]|uniref:hypothetical protein n=1 Tax=Arthrobacter sp. GMC3 TaxID=2058894 RepID=UPI000CE4FBEB|nr:hypothetical protein [Arthrobacter sp. GMC3]
MTEPSNPSQEIPREPFAYMSQPGGSRAKIRSPLGLILFAVFLMASGVAIFAIAVASSPTRGGGAIAAGIMMLLMFGGLGVTALVMGIKRLRWKNQYVHVTGHQPWT